MSLSAGPGEILALTGGPGAGKTTLLHAMLGLTPITGGSVEYAADPAPDRGITSVVGVVFSEPALHPSRTVRAHLQILTTGLREARLRIDTVAARTEIGSVLDKPARELDPAMTFRVALASALILDPSVLLIDEPVFGPGVTLEVAGPVVAQFAAAGGTAVIAGRGLEELSRLATHATVLHQGQQTWSGPISALQTRLRSNVLVATPAQKQFALTLAAAGVSDVTIRRDGRLLVCGSTPQRIAAIATPAGLPIHAMHPEHQGLDDIYTEFAGVPPVVPWGFGPVVPAGYQPAWAGAAR